MADSYTEYAGKRLTLQQFLAARSFIADAAADSVVGPFHEGRIACKSGGETTLDDVMTLVLMANKFWFDNKVDA